MPGFWRVSVVYGLGLILIEALLIVVSDFAFRFGASAFYLGCLIIPVLVPALVAGMYFGRHLGRAPNRSEAWRYAAWFASIHCGLLALVLWFAMQDFLAEESDGIVILVVLLFVYSVFALFMSLHFFGFGARPGARMREQR